MVVTGHKDPPPRSKPNSVMDHVCEDGSVKARAFYGEDGWKAKEIHTSDHGHPKQHPFGNHGEHVHDYEWNDDKSSAQRPLRELTPNERKENDDIL